MTVYFDNASTTRLDPEVFEAMKPFLLENFGNPSSLHSKGRHARAAIEIARKSIAELLNCLPSEIIFTSGGTEANNILLQGVIDLNESQTVITSPVEHHSVLEKVKNLQQRRINIKWLKIDSSGQLNYDQLNTLLSQNPDSIVSLMHVNNEIGTISDLNKIGEICSDHNAYFHTDAVAAVGHLKHDLKNSYVHGLTASAHKFHGPKGSGFMFASKNKNIGAVLHGGPQERKMRAGTENVAGIIGTAKALELAYASLTRDAEFVSTLKNQFVTLVKENIPGIEFNGDQENGLYTILNISLPPSPNNEMLLFNLDLKGIAASGGSACAAGARQDSHVLKAIGTDPGKGAIRFSFSRFNTLEEVKYVVDQLKVLFLQT